MRILKKYPNRRLYDTSQSRFVALDDVKRWVRAGETFEVQDSKTGELITRSVLLQIISDQETDASGALLADEVLRQLIRFYGNSLHSLLREYLERSVVLFLEQQEAFHDQLRSMLSDHPLNMIRSNVELKGDMSSNLAGSVLGDTDSGTPRHKQ